MIGDEQNGVFRVEGACDMNANAENAAQKLMINMRQRFRLWKIKLRQKVLKKHQRQRNRKKNHEKNRRPHAGETCHHPAMKDKSIHASVEFYHGPRKTH